VLAALTSVTEHLGLAATARSAFDDPSEVALRVADLDHLSAGRAGIRPVVLPGGDIDDGREAAGADVIIRRSMTLKTGQAFSADLTRSLARDGRSRKEVTVLSAATFVLGDTERHARERAQVVRHEQITGPTAIKLAERLWNRDLSAYDPDGPLPRIDPWIDGRLVARGRAGMLSHPDPVATARQWRALARRNHLSIREVVVEVTAQATFVGTAEAVATQINAAVQQNTTDGFLLVAHLTPLDEFADTVVPPLQDRGVFRSEYEEGTLRDRLGLTPTTKERRSHEHAS
jgi:alkanesulfonate monooxygenase SsuD/methylene tetrahydromethanopterin reductase-like flavin-dependent oxidoreductase (luciferase family)